MQYILGVLSVIGIEIIATVGLSVFTGFTGLFSLGHAAFMAIGAYTAAILTYFYNVPFLFALLAGMLMSAAVSMIIGFPTLRAKLRGDYFAIATLGFGEAVRVILENLSITQGARGLPGISHYTTLPVVMVFSLLVVWMTRNFIWSKYGRNAIAVREDAVASEMAGIDLFKVRMISLIYSAACGGLAGGLFAHYLNYIQPAMFTSVLSTQLTAAVVAGGMGSLTGPIIAISLFIAVPEVLRVANMWRLVVYGLILVLIMIYRPSGIMGYHEFSFEILKKIIPGRAAGYAGKRGI
ncbi:branched-chain amino acid ABC transporter permease [Thermosediminibacter litoriperuensis]|uniref:Amino acid/amide ABC transporter membrane protein 2, HAAT family (TC 3.A.1.4.-) n=1 Tax=Thermosediminibacter litoriperuensis TaxID=291989 RepID=A0A5S5B0N7_9FIRM|nr:branched-chain amino acid ABC transporter permease [Thermosediminibacter litoriperuensis]TYP58786.1 amino acid/amide ABC transporter membrane protein 2, HAAT family (TC 3.A.1.4.-) [Thermosediminibacter litoriperuensis]